MCRFIYEEMFYIEPTVGGALKITRKSNGEVLAEDTWAFSWTEGRGYSKTNRSYEKRVQKEAVKVKLIKR